MFLVVYASSATEKMTNEELEALLTKTRANNEKAGLTGLLLYKDGNFMQALESPKDAVTTVLRKIEVDSRHRGILRLIQRDQPAREFSNWSMGFRRLDTESASPLLGHSDFLDRPLNDESFEKNPSRALQLLLSFRKIVK
jgi:hypothetical protein